MMTVDNGDTCIEVDFLGCPQVILAIGASHKEGVGRVLFQVQQGKTPDDMSSSKLSSHCCHQPPVVNKGAQTQF